ncbi:MAG: hypothetical protein M1511_18120 [Deltaproteobacteria bacterium]|nr:hypothetical protein [Deltaproteobacteria bacterium]
MRDLLQEELAVTLESFKAGKDSGIDFRYCPDRTHTLIVQCKHYVGSGYTQLYRDLSKNELPKVKLLRPDRYIVATSVGLNPPQKDKIKKLFSACVKSSCDVLGKDDINNLLRKYPHIERQTMKLWLFSLPILQEVLHSQIHNFSKFEIDRIHEHAKLYVQNGSLEEAIRILETHNFCIIAGMPGIGKTVLAEMLVLHYSRSGYELVKIIENISEAWAVSRSELKRVFYYDDFLGQTSFRDKLHKNEDQRLIDFIRYVRRSSGAKLILTTREYILKQARQQYERLDREGLDDQKYIIDLAKYTRLNRAWILYNHIYFSDLPKDYRLAMLADRNYLRIIDHGNYSPRIVQLMTEHARIRDVEPTEYVTFFLTSMRNPLAIWDHAFRNHLSQASRNLLVVLASMPSQVLLSDLEKAFYSYNLAYARQYHATIGPQDVRSALKELSGDFLVVDKEGQDFLVQYQNPSVADFLKEYLCTSAPEMVILARSVAYFEQFRRLWSWQGSDSGRHTFIQLFKTEPELSVLLMRNLLYSGTCRLMNVVGTRGDRRKDRWPIPIEERAADVAGLIADSFTIFLPLLIDVVQEVSHRLQKGMGDRNGVGQLIEQTRSIRESVPDTLVDFVKVGKQFLMTTPVWTDDLWPLCRIIEANPELFSAKDFETIQGFLKEVADKVAYGYHGLDSDALREEAEALEWFAVIAGVDLNEEINTIRCHADEDEDSRSEDSEPIEYTSSKFRDCDVASNDYIASLFSTLDVRPMNKLRE